MSRKRESEVLRLARKLARRPCNRPGADKTWVIEAIRAFEDFINHARLVGRK